MNSTTPVVYPEDIVWSNQFKDEKADVTYISCDGVRFRIHSVFLRAHTEALAPEHGSSLDEPAPLPEPSQILELLFDFIYPEGEPIIKLEVDFDILLSLAEAAAKYQVFPALYVCNKQLRTVLPDHAVEILAYAYKHGQYTLVNQAAIFALDVDPAEVLDRVPDELFKSWLKYRQLWTQVQKKALDAELVVDAASMTALRRIGEKLSCLARPHSTLAFAWPHFRNWVEKHAKEVPTFTEFIGWKGDDITETQEVQSAGTQVIIETSDRHEKNIPLDILRSCTSNFGDIVNNRIKVTERSSTIDLLLRLITPVPSPELDTLEFCELKDLSLAVEKYSIRPARGFCRVLMKDAVQSHPHDVFHYAAEAHYLDILDLTAPLILGPINSFNDAIKRLPPRLVAAWVLYYQQWQEAVRIFLEAVRNESENKKRRIPNATVWGICTCRNDSTFNYKHVSPIFSRLLKEPGSLRNLDSILAEQEMCSQAQEVFDKCKMIAKDTIRAIPPLSSFV